MSLVHSGLSSDSSGVKESPVSGLSMLPSWVIQFLQLRGFADSDQVRSQLFSKLTDIKSPLALKGMQRAVARIVQAHKLNESICIYADFDLDGTSGVALLSEAFQYLGIKNFCTYQPRRLKEGYGLHVEAIQKLFDQGIKLIVTVDVGITANEAVDYARSLGMDVIITDHHLPSLVLPNAFCIVNPNQGDCPSGLGYLCGAGVSFYLARALKREFMEDPLLPKNDWDLKELLEHFVLGTLTDMVPLVEDNRILVKLGLSQFHQTKKAGYQALLKELKLDQRTLTAQDVAIRLAPKLNALSRMDGELLPFDLISERNLDVAKEKVKIAFSQNSERVSLQEKAEKAALANHLQWQHPNFYFVESEDFHKGIIGLVATKLCQELNVPVFVGSTKGSVISGSARLPASMSGSSLVTALQSASDFLNRYGGHSAAAGFELNTDKINEFTQSLALHYASNQVTAREIKYDLMLPLHQIDEGLMKWLDWLSPFGVGLEAPLFRFANVKVASVKVLKEIHLKVEFEGEFSVRREGLLFSAPAKLIEELAPNDYVDVVAELQWNYFAGKKRIQLMIKDLAKVSLA